MRSVSWSELQDHKGEGDLWIAINGCAYDVSAWAKRHPGGALVLLHAAGKDVTDAFNAYHPSWVSGKLASFRVGQMHPAMAKEPTEVRHFLLPVTLCAISMLQCPSGCSLTTVKLVAGG